MSLAQPLGEVREAWIQDQAGVMPSGENWGAKHPDYTD